MHLYLNDLIKAQPSTKAAIKEATTASAALGTRAVKPATAQAIGDAVSAGAKPAAPKPVSGSVGVANTANPATDPTLRPLKAGENPQGVEIVGDRGGRYTKVGASTPKPADPATPQGSATQGYKPSKSDPYSPESTHFAGDEPIHHYDHIQTLRTDAMSAGDPNLHADKIQMHRQHITAKTAGFNSQQHEELASQLYEQKRNNEAFQHLTTSKTLAASEKAGSPVVDPNAPSTGGDGKALATEPAKAPEAAQDPGEQGPPRYQPTLDTQDPAARKVVERNQESIGRAEKKHAERSSKFEEHTKKVEEAQKLHETSKTAVEQHKTAREVAEKAHKDSEDNVKAKAKDVETETEAAKSDHQKDLDKRIKASEATKEKHKKALEKAEQAHKKAAEEHRSAKELHDKLKKTQDKHAEAKVAAAAEMAVHKKAAPKHSEFQDTEDFKAAKDKHDRRGNKLKQKWAEVSAAHKVARVGVAPAAAKAKDAQVRAKEKEAALKEAKKAVDSHDKEHSQLESERNTSKLPDSPKVTKAKEAHAKAVEEHKDHAKRLKEATSAHDKAIKEHDSAGEAHEKAKQGHTKAKADVDESASEVDSAHQEAIQTESDHSAKIQKKEEDAAAKAQKKQEEAAAKQKPQEGQQPKGHFLSKLKAGVQLGAATGSNIGSASARAAQGAGAMAGAAFKYTGSGVLGAGHYLLRPNPDKIRKAMGPLND